MFALLCWTTHEQNQDLLAEMGAQKSSLPFARRDVKI